MKRLLPQFRNQGGGTLLITVVSLSMMILLLMSAATFKLAEVARHAARANEQLRFMNAMDDLAQTLARARVLGAPIAAGVAGTACPTGSTYTTAAGLGFCVPNSGSGGGAGITGICADLDQITTTTHDRYCIAALTAPTSAQLEDDEKSRQEMIAERSTFTGKLKYYVRAALSVTKAHAQCSWYGNCNPGAGSAGTANFTNTTVAQTFIANYTVVPTGSATEKTSSATGTARNNMEPWSPNLASWAPNNEMYVPSCAADNEYWIGCMRCGLPGVSCVKMTVCPAKNPSCAAAQRYEQLIAIW